MAGHSAMSNHVGCYDDWTSTVGQEGPVGGPPSPGAGGGGPPPPEGGAGGGAIEAP
jgi:hypothetical protein